MQVTVDLETIRRRAEKIGLHLGVLADAAGVHRTTLSRNFSGRAAVRHSTVQALADELGRRERTLLLTLAELHPDLVAIRASTPAEAAE